MERHDDHVLECTRAAKRDHADNQVEPEDEPPQSCMTKVRHCEPTSRNNEKDHQRDSSEDESPEDERSSSDLRLLDNDWPKTKKGHRA